MVWQPEKDRGRSKKKKTLDRWHETRPREAINYKLGRISPESWKLESIDRDGENSYRVMVVMMMK